MINSRMIYRIMGFLLLIETAMLMCCGGVSLFYKEDDLNSFLLSSAITAFVGVIMLAIGRGAEKSLTAATVCDCQCSWIRFLLFWNVALLYRRVYSKSHRCLLRDNVRLQQYRCHHHE